MFFVDQIGHKLIVNKDVKRIVSLVPSQTELIVDIGCEEILVGITRFCTHPKHLRSSVKMVGGTKDPNLSIIESLEPDLIICNKEENRKEDVEVLQKKYPTYTSNVIEIMDALKMISDLGDLLKSKEKANQLNHNIKSGFDKLDFPKSKSVAYLIWNDPIMVVNGNNFINSIITQMGLTNSFKNSQNRYSSITIGELSLANPDYIFLSSEPYPFKEKNKKEFQNKFPNSEIILVDGRMFSWYGSCLKETPNYIKSLYKILNT